MEDMNDGKMVDVEYDDSHLRSSNDDSTGKKLYNLSIDPWAKEAIKNLIK